MKSIIRNIVLAATLALCAAMPMACSDDETRGGDLQLFYPTVVDIGPSMNFVSGTPTYKGPAPSGFAIEAVTLDGQAVATDCFAINADTGVVTISGTDALQPGLYKLTLVCQAGGRTFRFRDIFAVSMSPATPEAIEVSAPRLEIPYADLASTEASVQVTPVGESVSILSYALVQPEGCDYFTISKQGVVRFDPHFEGEVMPGNYPLAIRVETYAGKATYEGLLTASITSEPLEVRYAPAEGRMEFGKAFRSVVPVLKGSPEEAVWAIREVEPAAEGFAIDPATGEISVAEGNVLPVGTVYTVGLTVGNRYGTADFDGAYRLTVIAYITPIDPATFAYEEAEAIQGGEFSIARRDGFVGDEATFSLGTLPAGLAGQLSIDPATGTVSARKGHSIPVGTYNIPVRAANSKGEAVTELKLTVKENPYYFTTIGYGNNLGLDPADGYADQFRCATADELAGLRLVPTTDAKPGTKLTWSIRIKHQCQGSVIDSETGELSVKGFKANNGGLILVTATAGAGEVGETSVTVPVFFSFVQPIKGVTIHYDPFVFRVNPRRGGSSVAPRVTGADPARFLMDYRRTFNYYNIGGPATHLDGQPTSATSFLYRMWKSYFTSIGSVTVNTGSKDPVSYYSNVSRLGSALLYVDPVTKSVVVNANKWVDADNTAANGAFIAQMTFVTDGNQGGVNGGSQVFPLWIWFDEKF